MTFQIITKWIISINFKHIKRVIFVPILDSGYETPQLVLGITVRSYTTNGFCECLPMWLRQFPSEKIDAQTTFPICQGQIASIACFFPRFVVTSPCSCDIGWSLTIPATSELDLIECWLCCLGNHWKYPLSSHHISPPSVWCPIAQRCALWASDYLASRKLQGTPTNMARGKPGKLEMAGSITRHHPTQNRRWSTWRSTTRLAVRQL